MFAFTTEISYHTFRSVQVLVFFLTTSCLSYSTVADSSTESPPAKGDQAITEESAQRILKDANAGDVHAQFALADVSARHDGTAERYRSIAVV
jgi:phage gp29-like protein